MVKVGILGATGYAAFELIKILLRHPQVQIVALTSRQEDQPHISEAHPYLSGRLDIRLQNATAAEIADSCDCLFSCLPHAASASAILPVLDRVRVIDFSADYRLEDPETYREWYGGDHPDPQRLGRVAYGLPEICRSAIVGARLVANPGCYSSTAIMGLAPLLSRGWIDPQDIIIDAKSGVSGAGRSLKLPYLFAECNESLTAYAVGRHRHSPEIEQVLSRTSGRKVSVLFTPHLVPMDRGILCSIYTRPAAGLPPDESQILESLRQHYADSPFVRVVDHIPATKYVSGTNFCDITVRRTPGRLLVFACTDNLIKGAAGVAVQNFNLMFGFDETEGLM